MKCALKTDSVNESLCSPEFTAGTLITIFSYRSENECMQIICKGTQSSQIMAKWGSLEVGIIGKGSCHDLAPVAVAWKSISQGKGIFYSMLSGPI